MSLRKRNAPPPSATRNAPMRFGAPRQPERLVGVGFRCWFAGYDTCDIDCWETGWNYYARELGVSRAKEAVGELACWVRAVRDTACRKIAYYPFGCAGFAPDECVAISMVAAGQHAQCPAMRACAFALLGTSDIDTVVDSAQKFACVLADTGYVLSDQSICNANLLVDPAHTGIQDLNH